MECTPAGTFSDEGRISSLRLRRHPRYAALLLIAALLIGSGCRTVVYQPDLQVEPKMTAYQARQKIQETLRKEISFGPGCYPENVQVTSSGFSYVYPGTANTPQHETYSYQFDELSDPKVISGPLVYYGGIVVAGDKELFHWRSQTDASDFADALRAVRYYSSSAPLVEDAAAFAEFKEKAAAWRALPQKPEIPEDARRYMVLFEDAYQKKEFEKAANYGDQGLAVCPLWPDMQFNAALVYGETGMYAEAICHMKRYLELFPDSPKARDARNKMYIWEEKVKEAGSAGSPAGGQTGQTPDTKPRKGFLYK